MKVKELIEELKNCDQEAEVWTGTTTPYQGISTYGLVDIVYQNEFESFWTDLFPTPDEIDTRLYDGRSDKNDNIVYIGTTFGR